MDFKKPNTEIDIQSITIKMHKNSSNVETTVRPAIMYKLKGLDSQRYTVNHIELLKEFHNEAATDKLYKKISADGFLIHGDNVILRIKTEDNRVYVLYQGILFAVSQTLRLSRIFGTIPNNKVEEIVEGEYEAKNLQFTYEKQAFPKRDLEFQR